MKSGKCPLVDTSHHEVEKPEESKARKKAEEGHCYWQRGLRPNQNKKLTSLASCEVAHRTGSKRAEATSTSQAARCDDSQETEAGRSL